MRTLAVRLQITRAMRRLFLSGQMTCAMLLGAGLLLRAQAALRTEPEMTQAAGSPRTRPSEMTGERARVAPRVVRTEPPATPRAVQKNSHKRKGFTHRQPRPRVRKSGVALAGRWFRVG